MKVQSAALAMAVALLGFGACSTSSNSPSGTSGITASGGAGGGTGSGGSSGGNEASCSNVTPCGGSAVGSWTVSSSCLKLSGDVDIAAAGLDPRSCTKLTISGTVQVSGTWSANANGTYTDGTSTTGEATLELPAGCLNLSGTTTNCEGVAGPLQGGLGFNSLTCLPADGGGCTCNGEDQSCGRDGIAHGGPAKERQLHDVG